MADERFRIGRRTLLGGAAACAAIPRGAAAEQVQPKASKADTQYTDKSKDMFTCAICSFFVEPKGCKVIEGDVSRDGWCNLFALAD